MSTVMLERDAVMAAIRGLLRDARRLIGWMAPAARALPARWTKVVAAGPEDHRHPAASICASSRYPGPGRDGRHRLLTSRRVAP